MSKSWAERLAESGDDEIVISIDEDMHLPSVSPICAYCSHTRHALGPRRCDAFPNGIPETIWTGDNDHTEPYPGDHGIRFKLVPGSVRPVRSASRQAA